MKKLDKDKLPFGCETAIRLFSGNVKNFNLWHVQGFRGSHYHFGFTMKRNKLPLVHIAEEAEDSNECSVLLDKKGLELLITFLNKLCKDT